jgi:hypothetical protein
MPTTADVVPYCGVILGAAERPIGLVTTVLAVKKRIGQALNATWLGYDHDYAPDGGTFLTAFFSYEHPPHWAPNSTMREITHCYFSVGLTNGYFVFHCSDNEVKETILDLLDSNSFEIKRIPREVLNYAFIEGSEIRTIWLHGIHKKTTVKADSKALTGSNLRYAFDPSADQTYSYNSLRGSVQLGNKDRTFGVNLAESYLWLYRLNSWSEFLANCDVLTTTLKNARGRKSSTPLDTVSHPISDPSIMKGLYDFAILDPDNPLSGSFGQTRTSLLATLKSEYEYDVAHRVAQDNIIRLTIHHVQDGLRSYIGDVVAEPIIHGARFRFNVSHTNPQRGQIRKLQEFERVFSHPALVQAWYDSGHTIIGGSCYEVSYKSAPFNGMYWSDFRGTNILKEKPDAPAGGGPILSNIGSPGEDSLFSWVYRALLRGTREKRLSHLRMSSAQDWLLCDDGSGEISDFLHATTLDNHHHLTLIHVKAANSDQQTRLISVSAHDVVINQAIKNIGNLNKDNVVNALSQRVPATSSKPTWNPRNGSIAPVAGIDFVNHLSSWSPGRMHVHVVIVQPHTLRSAFRNRMNSKQHDQLSTLLNSAAHQIAGLGGTLTVIGSRN